MAPTSSDAVVEVRMWLFVLLDLIGRQAVDYVACQPSHHLGGDATNKKVIDSRF